MTRPIGPRKIPPVRGGVAQLGERRVRNAEVVSSILIRSTTRFQKGLIFQAFFFSVVGLGISLGVLEMYAESPNT